MIAPGTLDGIARTCVLQADRGDDGDVLRLEYVRTVYAAAEANLDHLHLHVGLAEDRTPAP
jgi:hypothetical protein